MKRIIKYLKSKDIILLHNLIVDSTGGSHGISDYDLFMSAVLSPHSTFVGQEMYQTPIEKASALLHSLLTKPVFFNKEGKKAEVNSKTAFLACATFLELNGYQFNADPNQVSKFIL